MKRNIIIITISSICILAIIITMYYFVFSDGNFNLNINIPNIFNFNKNSGTLTCTKTYTEDGNQINDTMVVTYKNNKVTNVENTNITEYTDISMVDMTVSFGQLFATSLNEVDGFNVSYSKESDSKVKYIMNVNYDELNIDSLKEKFGDEFDEDAFFASKNISLDDFKSKNLNDYTCN